MDTLTATITFPTRDMATKFAINWSRYSLQGHTIGSGTESVVVNLYGVNEVRKQWIDDYVKNINEYLND